MTTVITSQHVELLPAREALFWGRSVRKTANVSANNQSAALNVASLFSGAFAYAEQNISVTQ